MYTLILYSEEVVWLTVKLGDQERTFERKASDVQEKKSVTFLVHDLKNEKVNSHELA